MRFIGPSMNKLVAGIFLLSLTLTSFAKDPVYQTKSGVAINGYDPVAYFSAGKPVKGQSIFHFSYLGTKWLFSSPENLELFKNEPTKYAPQYGGYCAYAVSQGKTAKTEPKAWTIVAGKLYLNYSLGIKKKWKKDISGYIKKADTNWPSVLD